MESEEGNNFIPSINPQESNVPMEMEGQGHENDNTLGNEDVSQVVPSKRKNTSEVWNHFKKVKEGGEQYAICNYCTKSLKASPSHGTTHLKKHYEKTCLKRPGQMDIRQSVLTANKKVSGKELTTHIFKQEDSRRELANMVIMHDYPLSIVDHLGFRRYSASLQPCFSMITRNTLKSDILKTFKVEKEKCYKVLDKLKSRIAITTDMWTSDNANKGFMAITAHYIDDSWILRNFILRFVYVPAPHTAEVMADILVESFMDWNIDKKLSTITVDNCSTNDAMLRALPNKLPRSDLLLNGKVLHMRCCAHILNLIVKDGLDVISGAITNIRDSVIFWTGSPSRLEKFEEAAQQLHLDFSKKLSLDCKTRWNSTYLMLETAIKYRNVFVRLKLREKSYKCLPTDEEWDNASELCGKLKLFHTVTEMFSGKNYPTSNFYFSMICDIKLELNKWLDSPKEMVKVMAQMMVEKFDKYWNECHLVMSFAAILDPRYKLKLIQLYIRLIYGEDSESKVCEIRKNCYDLLIDYQSRSVSEESLSSNTFDMETSSSNISSSITNPVQTETMKLFDRINASSTNPSTSPSISDLDKYLEEDLLPRTPNFDILNWWKTNGGRYPSVQKIARDILAIPVSTVASESAFSDSGRLVSPHRNRLHPSTIEALMCSRRWLWNEEMGSYTSLGPSSLHDEEEDVPEE